MSIDLADHISIDEALRDPALFGAALGSTDTWSTWLATLKAAFGIALNREERRAFEAIAGSRKPPRHKVQELWCLVGRGGGKSRMAAAIACYIACFIHHDLDPGENWLRAVPSGFQRSGQHRVQVLSGVLKALSNPATYHQAGDLQRNHTEQPRGHRLPRQLVPLDPR
jgi:hypothetical protein